MISCQKIVYFDLSSQGKVTEIAPFTKQKEQLELFYYVFPPLPGIAIDQWWNFSDPDIANMFIEYTLWLFVT